MLWTKISVIRHNVLKYRISAMCRVLKIPRSVYYYESRKKDKEDGLKPEVIEIFKSSRSNYGTRKMKAELRRKGIMTSRRRISRIMKLEGLVSRYTVAQYRPAKSTYNEAETANMLQRDFNNHPCRNAVVNDLTYVRVGMRWNYICILVDLYNREIIGYSTGANKDSRLVFKAFSRVKGNLSAIQIFHTDRGNEFKNSVIEETLEAFGIERSLSRKGSPYDNAVAEATFKIVKTEFVKGNWFETLERLELEFMDYVNWFNNFRIHSSLGYMSPIEYRNDTLKKVV